MAHMTAYTPDDLNRLHRRWHGLLHSGRHAQTRHLGNPYPQSPGASCPGQGHRAPTPTVFNGPGTPETSTTTLPSRHRPGVPADVSSPYSPQQSPLRPFAHPQTDRGSPNTPRKGTAWHAPWTLGPHQGAGGSTGAQRRSRTPSPAAPRVVFHNDGDGDRSTPSGRQRRPMSPAASHCR